MLQWLQKKKNVRLVFLMASSTALVAEKSQDHQYPRHLALGRGARPSPSGVAIGVVVASFYGEISISYPILCWVRVNPLFAAKVRTVAVLICSCRVAWELLIVCMLSVWMKPPAYMSSTEGPKHLLCRDFKRRSIISRKRTRERTDPWRTSRSRVNGEDSSPSTLTMLFGDVY